MEQIEEKKLRKNMNIREQRIRLWFDMWLQKRDLGMEELFSDDAVYIESWGPEYTGIKEIKHWFCEWNGRGTVLIWDIKQMIHAGDQTVVEWYFENKMNDGKTEAFDGISLIHWSKENKIEYLKEFGCNCDRYDPYKNGDDPEFSGESPLWF